MATPEAPPLYNVLLSALDDLEKEEFAWFKTFLRDHTLVGDFGVIDKRKLQTDKKTEILDAMLDSYGIFTINIIKRALKTLNQKRVLDELDEDAAQYDPEVMITKCCQDLKSKLKPKFEFLVESVSKSKRKMLFHEGYIELYIAEADTEQIDDEEEHRQMETRSIESVQPVHCQDIFTIGMKEPIRVVLTKGVAGVGKTVLTQKFSLDWAEGTANKDIQLLFPLTFRELNKFKDTEFSLVGLVHHCFKQTKALFSFQHIHVCFIFDGLDECRFSLDFDRTRVLTKDTESTSIEELLVNLIRGDLLPSASLWITTRPAAANQIPEEFVSIVTEVRGFTETQKEQYFKKRFRDEQQATAVISHIKSIRSLYIMCDIPVFCWILSDVLLHLLKTNETAELPKTLTQMYVHFLVVQAKVKSKYDGRSVTNTPWTPETKEMIQSLGKLAFEQLQNLNLIFCESDLSDYGLNEEIACHSGVFTEVFKEEPGQGLEKVYCFIHLSVQEFLAALHVHQTFYNSGENLLLTSHTPKSPDLDAFYRSAVDRALQSQNRNLDLDLFLRFLLGLALPTNHKLMTGLLNHKRNEWDNQGTVKYIKKRLNEKDVPIERTLNLFHCLNELNDRSLLERIQGNIRNGRFSRLKSYADWSAVSFILLSSDSNLEEFDLKKYFLTEEALLGLLPVVKASTKAIMSACGLSSLCCGRLASVFSSSSLTHLDLSNNDLWDSGLELLCAGLMSTSCSLEKLWLSGCLISERGGTALASALSQSHLMELDLSYNHPGPSAELLTALRAPQGPLQMLRLDPAGEQWMVPGLKKYACEFSLDPNTAHRRVLVSQSKRIVSVATDNEAPAYPDHEDRFTEMSQVLSSTGLSGRCYWEVEWRGLWVDMAVSYRGIQRKGVDGCLFGNNDHSWNLRVKVGNCSAFHNGIQTHLTYCNSSHKIAVFLDSEAGTLSFYEVSFELGGRLLHLHTFNAVFTEPLYPGFGLYNLGCEARLVDPNLCAESILLPLPDLDLCSKPTLLLEFKG